MVHPIITSILLVCSAVIAVRAIPQIDDNFDQYSLSNVISIWSTTNSKNSQPVVSGPALDKIHTIVGSRPVFVITVVGGYHTGKSSLLNVLLGEDKFTVGESMKSETQSFDAVVITKPDESKPAIILIDTPGTGAYEFGSDMQAAYFGAAYLVSSTMVYNTLRQVGSRESLDFMAQRLRWVLSVNATVPKDCELQPNTAEVKLEWVVQNADFNATQAHPEKQLQQYINTYSEEIFDLKEIFPKGINPHILPSPGDPLMMQRLSVHWPEDRWNAEYLKAIAKLKRQLFTIGLKEKGKSPRVWSDFNTWRKRVFFAFSDPVANTLKALEEAPLISAKKAMEAALIDEARSYGHDYFQTEADKVPVNIINIYEQQLLDKQAEAIALIKRRAVAVSEQSIQREIDKEVKTFFRSEIKRLVAQMNDRIQQIWNAATRDVNLQYSSGLRTNILIPFDPHNNQPFKTEREKAQAQLRAAVGNLANDGLQWSASLATLNDQLTGKDNNHKEENERAIAYIVGNYANYIENELEATAKKLTNNFNDKLPPVPGMDEKVESMLGEIIFASCTTKGVQGAPNPPIPPAVVQWIAEVSHFKLLKGTLAESKSRLVLKAKEVHKQRISMLLKSTSSLVRDSLTECVNGVIKGVPKTTSAMKAELASCEDTGNKRWKSDLRDFWSNMLVVEGKGELDQFVSEVKERAHQKNSDAIKRFADEIANKLSDDIRQVANTVRRQITNGPIVEAEIKDQVGAAKARMMSSFAEQTKPFSDSSGVFSAKSELENSLTNYEKQLLGENVKVIIRLASSTTTYLKEQYIEQILFDTIDLPVDESVLNKHIKASKSNCTAIWNKELGSFARSHSQLLESMIKDWELSFGEWIKILNGENLKRMKELVQEPSNVAKRHFLKHLQSCAMLPISDRISNLECIKIDSTSGLPCLKSIAKMLLLKEINAAIEKSRAESTKDNLDSSLDPSGRKKRKMLVSMSRSMIDAVTKATLASWWIEPELSNATTFSYMVVIASCIAAASLIGFVGLLDVLVVILIALVAFAFLFA